MGRGGGGGGREGRGGEGRGGEGRGGGREGDIVIDVRLCKSVLTIADKNNVEIVQCHIMHAG